MPSMSVVVTINGTNQNPWRRFGLRCNPFPQIPRHEYNHVNTLLRQLDSDPIPDVDSLKRILAGKVTQELLDLCVKQYRPGERVTFNISFPE